MCVQAGPGVCVCVCVCVESGVCVLRVVCVGVVKQGRVRVERCVYDTKACPTAHGSGLGGEHGEGSPGNYVTYPVGFFN